MNTELESSFKTVFIILHVLFIGGASFYVYQGQLDLAAFFAVNSLMSLNYYIIYQSTKTQRRVSAHLNLIDEAVKGSEEFRDNVKKSSGTEPEKQEPIRGEKLEKALQQNKEEAIQTIEDQFKRMEDYTDEEKIEYLEEVEEAEKEGKNRSGVINFTSKEMIEIYKGESEE